MIILTMLLNLGFAECKLKSTENPNISISKNMLIINGDTYYVKGSDNKARFAAILTECQAMESLKDFNKWRTARGWTKGVFWTGLILGGAGAIYAVIPAAFSSHYKNNLLDTLYIELQPTTQKSQT